MRIECRHGLNYFFTFHEQNWTSIYQVKGDTRYEQMPWIFNNQVNEVHLMTSCIAESNKCESFYSAS